MGITEAAAGARVAKAEAEAGTAVLSLVSPTRLGQILQRPILPAHTLAQFLANLLLPNLPPPERPLPTSHGLGPFGTIAISPAATTPM